MSLRLLKQALKESIANIIYLTSPTPQGSRMPGTDCKAMIIYYHRVVDSSSTSLHIPDLAISVKNFEEQILFLKESYEILPLDELVEALSSGVSMEPPSIAITFDDGYADNYHFAYPILQKHSIPATVFLATGYMDSDRLFWWDRLRLLLNSMQSKSDTERMLSGSIDPELLRLIISATDPGFSLTPLTHYLKSMGREPREHALKSIEDLLTESALMLPCPKDLFLTWEQVKEMASGGVDFGSHTHNHPVLTECSDTEIVNELTRSKALIKEKTGIEVKSFSYPDGCLDSRVEGIVSSNGYSYAVQTGRNDSNGIFNRFAIPRKMVKEGHSVGLFKNFSKALFAMELTGRSRRLFLRDLRSTNPYSQKGV
jgi:peptidoglycan/xylan/chitin deacetylase (PgdA/CDA1 family)